MFIDKNGLLWNEILRNIPSNIERQLKLILKDPLYFVVNSARAVSSILRDD